MSKSIQERLKKLEALYKCMCLNPSGGTGTQGPPGLPGAPGQGFTYQGNWSSTTTYHPYDVVTYLGSTFITPFTNTGSTPSYDNSNSDWYLFTSIGGQGIQGIPGIPGTGGGGSSCPDHFKLAAVSGRFGTNSPNSPDMKEMFSGSEALGWSYGAYASLALVDGFGNLGNIPFNAANCGIPLPIDLNQGDIVRFSGILYIINDGPIPDPGVGNFYITLSTFGCSEVGRGGGIPLPGGPRPVSKGSIRLTTAIPVTPYLMGDTLKVCFSESVSLTEILPANETFFVVGLGFGNDNEENYEIGFSYTLDVTQACIGTGENLLIRSCCDPAYTNVIIDNGVELGKSFVDDEGYCWSVDSKTINPVTATRTIETIFNTCQACTDLNICPENFIIESCCNLSGEVFSAALEGVDVGDTFVDANGYCWSAIGTTGTPITNSVDVITTYPQEGCGDATCIEANPCPVPVRLDSCCTMLSGYTTLSLLQNTLPSLQIGDYFVDTFGFCWSIQSDRGLGDSGNFPDLSFIVPDTEYVGCEDCINANECPREAYYTIQNCCTEEIEVVQMNFAYNTFGSLLLQLSTGFGCYEVLSWSNTGTVTATLVDVVSIEKDCRACAAQIAKRLDTYCPGRQLTCTSYRNESQSPGYITGYKCDGTWVVNSSIQPNESICMAQVVEITNLTKLPNCCGFDALNPSPTLDLDVTVITCDDIEYVITVPPNTLVSTVLAGFIAIPQCIKRITNNTPNVNFVYAPC